MKNKKSFHKITLQNVTRNSTIPSRYYFQRWITMALDEQKKNYEITIRIVGETESKKLNHTYRHKNKPTNVLSFPFEAPKNINISLLGDLVICAPVIAKEAKEQKKLLLAHWAHMVIHGTLHLLGYDHVKADEAEVMEKIEIELMKQLGFENPYE